jgi:Tfp pilus assembly protein PilF
LQIAVLNNLGLVLQLQRRFAEADRTFQKSLLKARSQSGRQSLLYAQILENIGQLRIDERKLKQAEHEFREALRIRRKLADSNGPEVAESLNSIAGLYTLRGRHDKAEQLYRQALTATERSFGQNHLRGCGNAGKPWRPISGTASIR